MCGGGRIRPPLLVRLSTDIAGFNQVASASSSRREWSGGQMFPLPDKLGDVTLGIISEGRFAPWSDGPMAPSWAFGEGAKSMQRGACARLKGRRRFGKMLN
jgi:hypothetical protein